MLIDTIGQLLVNRPVTEKKETVEDQGDFSAVIAELLNHNILQLNETVQPIAKNDLSNLNEVFENENLLSTNQPLVTISSEQVQNLQMNQQTLTLENLPIFNDARPSEVSKENLNTQYLKLHSHLDMTMDNPLQEKNSPIDSEIKLIAHLENQLKNSTVQQIIPDDIQDDHQIFHPPKIDEKNLDKVLENYKLSGSSVVASDDSESRSLHIDSRIDNSSSEQTQSHFNQYSLSYTESVQQSNNNQASTIQQNIDNRLSIEQSISEQVEEHVKFMFYGGQHKALIKLSPENLGQISIEITQQDGKTNIIFNPTQESTQVMINQNLNNLMESLHHSGITLDGVVVTDHDSSPQQEQDLARKQNHHLKDLSEKDELSKPLKNNTDQPSLGGISYYI